jgi:hypothetical protein
VSSVELEDSSDQPDGAEEVDCELVVTCGDRAELLHFLEETLDQIALFVKNVVAGTFDEAVVFGRDDDIDSGLPKPFDQGVGIVAFVADQSAASHPVEQVGRSAHVMNLARRQDESNRVAQRVGEGVDFGRQTAAGTSYRLVRAVFFRAPALC